ncbi:MAG: hypothetical protein IPM57_12085 [Oligoflexia bacterium]|nr:hypothetical protein [Oligoflexia bacterium]
MFLILFFFASNFSQASVRPTYVKILNPVNARSEANFIDSSVVLKESPLPAETEGEILDYVQLNSGNYGIKLKITTSPNRNLKGKVAWVYHNVKDAKQNHFVKLYTDLTLQKQTYFEELKPIESCTNCTKSTQVISQKQAAPIVEATARIESHINKPEIINKTTIPKAQPEKVVQKHKKTKKLDKIIPCLERSLSSEAKRLHKPNYADLSKSKGYCYKHVKDVLFCSEFVTQEEKNSWHSSEHSYAKVEHFENRGFINLYPKIKNIDDAPNGAILLYRKYVNGRPTKVVHTEIKVERNNQIRYVSDLVTPNPIIQSTRKRKTDDYELIGVMVHKENI